MTYRECTLSACNEEERRKVTNLVLSPKKVFFFSLTRSPIELTLKNAKIFFTALTKTESAAFLWEENDHKIGSYAVLLCINKIFGRFSSYHCTKLSKEAKIL